MARDHESPAKVVLDTKRRGVIKSALKEYAVEDLIDAFSGVALSPHHRGENEARMVYDSIELILRDANHIEKFRDLTQVATDMPHPRGYRTVRT